MGWLVCMVWSMQFSTNTHTYSLMHIASSIMQWFHMLRIVYWNINKANISKLLLWLLGTLI